MYRRILPVLFTALLWTSSAQASPLDLGATEFVFAGSFLTFSDTVAQWLPDLLVHPDFTGSVHLTQTGVPELYASVTTASYIFTLHGPREFLNGHTLTASTMVQGITGAPVYMDSMWLRISDDGGGAFSFSGIALPAFSRVSGTGQLTVVPEPPAFALALLATIALITWRRRHTTGMSAAG